MKQIKKCLALLLTAALCGGLLCVSAGAEASGDAGGSVIPEDQSQGAVRQEGDMVHVALSYGTEITLTSAEFGGTVSFPDPWSGETVTLKTIIAKPGCIAYATSADGQVHTAEDEGYADMGGPGDYENYGRLLCHHYGVQADGTLAIEGMNDYDLLGNTYARFGLDGNLWGYSVFITFFYADDGCYWITTREALDLFTSLTGIEETGAPEKPTFTDVSPDAWYYTFVETAAKKGLFAGAGDGTFAPEANMTYAEFLTVLSQFSGETLTPVTGGAWYDTYVQWAQPLIPEGMKEYFNPTAPITRQDMAALFGNFLERYDHPGKPVNSQVPSFVDSSDVADYAANGVTAVYQMGLMSGADGNRFLPLATATRAQVAVTMVQMARVMGK